MDPKIKSYFIPCRNERKELKYFDKMATFPPPPHCV